MIAPQMLAQMQRTAQTLMTTPATILRKQQVSDRAGGFVDTWSETLQTVCMVAFPSAGGGGREEIALGRIEEQDRVTIRLPAGTDVAIRDRISAAGVTYEVQSVAAPRTVEISRVVQCVVVVS